MYIQNTQVLQTDWVVWYQEDPQQSSQSDGGSKKKSPSSTGTLILTHDVYL